MIGSREGFQEVPWFWSDQYDVNLQMLGHPEPGHRRVLRGSIEERACTVLYLDGGRVLAAVALNRPGDVAAVRRLIERRIEVDAGRLADSDVSLRELVKR
jgi:3-phenylpropionate/trans-cinnamate dioxygenase ferredoxin reductase subunit